MCSVRMEALAFVFDKVDVDLDDDGDQNSMACASVTHIAGCSHVSSRKALFDTAKETRRQKSLKAEEKKVSLRQPMDW